MPEPAWRAPGTHLPQPTALIQVAMGWVYLRLVIQGQPKNKAALPGYRLAAGSGNMVLDRLHCQPSAEPLQLDCTKDDGDVSPESVRYPVTRWVSFVLCNPVTIVSQQQSKQSWMVTNLNYP